MTTVTITDIGSDEVIIPVSDTSDIIVQTLSDGPPLGNYIADHSLAINLESDDHPQYLNITRGDARYASKSHEEDTTIHFTLDDVVVEASGVIGLNQPNILYVANIGDPENAGFNLVQPYSSILYNTTASFTTEYKAQLDNIDTANLLYTSNINSTVQGYSLTLSNTTASFTSILETKLNGIEEAAQVNNLTITDADALTSELNTALHFHNSDRDRTNHTGTQPLNSVVNSNVIGSPINNKNLQEVIGLFHSSGFTSPMAVFYIGGGQLSITGGEYYIRSTSDGTGVLYSGSIAEDTSLIIPNLSTSFVYLDYNAGTPIWASTTNPTEINVSDKIPVAIIYRNGEAVNILNVSNDNTDCIAKFRKKSFYTEKFVRAEGALVAHTGLSISCTTGKYWFGLNEFTHGALAEGASFTYYHKGTNWVATNATIINPTQYNLVNTGLSTLSNKHYSNQWIYSVFGTATNAYAVVYGQNEYATLAEAINEAPPANLPPVLSSMGILVGVVTIYENTGTIVNIRSVFDHVFAAIDIPNHNNLSGLNVDGYQHLTAEEKTLFDTLHTSNPPATSTSPGIAGTITWDASNIYVCVATNTWVKSPLTTW